MSKFNFTKRAAKPDAVSCEGGAVFEKRLEEDWVNNLLSNMLENRYYETGSEQMQRYIDLTKQMLEKYGPSFVARAAYFARNEIGMRSISQLTAALLNGVQFEGKRDFYKNYMHRPDDVSEIFSILESLGEKRSHALVRGAADYISTLSGYQLDKYRMPRKDWSMIDLINVTHPKGEMVDKFYNGTLEKADTWEQRISASTSDEEKAANWRDLVESKSLGYLALIRNLNNILASDVTEAWIEQNLVPQLVDEQKIRKSLVFPYQIYVAYKNLEVREVNTVFALDRAFRIAVKNIPGLEGKSLIVLDVSGSMDDNFSNKSSMSIKEVCACYAAAIYLVNKDSKFIKFGNHAKERSYNRLDSVFMIIKKMQTNEECGYGTDIGPVWDMLDEHYERIFLFSDMQVMVSNPIWYYSSRDGESADAKMKRYERTYGRTHVFSFDLGNYSTQISNPRRGDLTFLTSLSDKTFKFVELIESGKNLIDYIQSIQI